MAEVEADKIARPVDRVDALDGKGAAAEDAWAGQQRAFDWLPEDGEPIKMGHHSGAATGRGSRRRTVR